MSAFVDSFAISAHKIRGPRGIGALWLSRPLDAFVCGGGQESGLRPGTENLLGALAFRFAVETVSESLDTYTLHARQLEKRIIEGVSHIRGASVVPERVPGDEAYVPSILSIAFPGLGGETMVRALSDRHIAVSTGSACSSNQRHRGRRVLQAMGVPDDIAFSAIRVSTGPLTTPEEIDIFLEQADDLYRTLKTDTTGHAYFIPHQAGRDRIKNVAISTNSRRSSKIRYIDGSKASISSSKNILADFFSVSTKKIRRSPSLFYNTVLVSMVWLVP